MTDVVQGHCDAPVQEGRRCAGRADHQRIRSRAAIAIDIDGAIEKIFDVQCDGPDVLLLNPFRPRLRSAIARIDSVQASSDPSAPSVTSIWSTRLSADHAP